MIEHGWTLFCGALKDWRTPLRTVGPPFSSTDTHKRNLLASALCISAPLRSGEGMASFGVYLSEMTCSEMTVGCTH